MGQKNVGRLQVGAVVLPAAALVLVSVAVDVARIRAVVQHSDLYVTTGAEGPGIYGLWKSMHGYPVYELPTHATYATSLYNFLFFGVYAAVLRLFGATTGPALLVEARVLTLGFAALGAVVHWRLLVRMLDAPASRIDRLILAMMAFVTWFGPGFAKWWFLTVRPDMAALACEALGVLLFLRALGEARRAPWLVGASLFFWAAWAFKQSYVCLFGGVIVYAVVSRRSAKDLAALLLPLVLPMAFLVVVTLGLGGHDFRYNLLVAPGLSAFTVRQSVTMLAKSVVPNVFVFVFPVVAAVFLPDAMRRQLVLPLCLLLVALPLNVLMVGKGGSNTNYLYEAFWAASTLAAQALVRLERASALAVAGALLVTMMVMPLALLLTGNGQASLGGFQTSGGLLFATDEQYLSKKRFAEWVDALPKPILIRDEILAQPWHATGERYPALMLDYTYYADALRHGTITDGGVAHLVSERYFATMLVSEGDDVYEPGLRYGYTQHPVTIEGGEPGLRLLSR